MKSTSDDFRTSVEFDIHQNADKLDFLIDYTFVSLQLNTPNFKRFILKKDDEEYVLEVTGKSCEMKPDHPQWETDQYLYDIKKL